MKFFLFGSIAVAPATSSLVGINNHSSHHDSKVCWTKKPVKGVKMSKKIKSKSLLQKNPGAGIEEVVPYETVFKDGFFKAACVNDSMLEVGDKHGINHGKYDLHTENVSIVRYEDVIDASSRDAMTPTVCYEFCRTVPDMNFFGLFNGRECYCAPYFRSKAGNNAQCDAPCDGDSSQFCGGQNKSQMFAMHHCANTVRDMDLALTNADTLKDVCYSYESRIRQTAHDLEDACDDLKSRASTAGDTTVSNYAQAGKEIAGVMIHTADDLDNLGHEMDVVGTDVDTVPLDDALAHEDITHELERLSASAADVCLPAAEHFDEMMSAVDNLHSYEPEVADDIIAGLHQSYYNVYYFQHAKKFGDVSRDVNFAKPSTCEGDMITDPSPVNDMEECLFICDRIPSCTGVQFYGRPGGQHACFLLGNVTGIRLYQEECISFLQGSGSSGSSAATAATAVKSTRALRKQPFQDTSTTGAKCVMRFSSTKGFQARMSKEYLEADRIEVEDLDRCF